MIADVCYCHTIPVTQYRNLHNKTRYVCLSVCLFVCMLPMAGRTAGPIKTKLGSWHRDSS